MKTVAIIQARMGSTRLPGKVLMDICGKPMLQWCVEACRAAETVDDVAVTTWAKPEDDEIEELCDGLGVTCHRMDGPPLMRFADAARVTHAFIIVRVCGDSPFMPSSHIDAVVDELRDDKDYSAYRLPDGRPAILGKFGVFPEAFTRLTLVSERLYVRATEDHCTHGMYTKPRPYAIGWIPTTKPDVSLDIDTIEDLEFVRQWKSQSMAHA